MTGFSPEAEEALVGYSWPGNVRELRNVVERSLLLKRSGDLVTREDLPPLGESGGAGPDAGAVGRPLPEVLRRTERRLILEALRRHDGVVARAAKELGISRTNLHNKLRKHGLISVRQWGDESHET